MGTRTVRPGHAGGSPVGSLLRAAHPGPVLAVTALTTAYAVSLGPEALRGGLLPAAVLTGQLTIGWSNDLIDARRDAAVLRADKPLATGALSPGAVRLACLAALAATVPLSLACGILPGMVHLVCCVGAGWAYNLRLKSTALSWVPYAVAFGSYPIVVSLSAPDGALPPLAVPAAGALLGIGAHLVNVLPDLEDDAATGVRGLPHRLGENRARTGAVLLLVLASALLLGRAERDLARLVVAGAVVLLSGVALTGRGRRPFRAAVAIALVDAALLVADPVLGPGQE